MARKTKSDAQITRDQLLDAAEHLFQQHGVSRTALQQIAEQAGLTRGAIYWHFKDKAELFNAMMERVRLPFEEIIERLRQDSSHSPLSRLRQILQESFHRIHTDEQTRRVFEIIYHKIEIIGEIDAVMDRRNDCRREFLAMIENELAQAAASGHIRPDIAPRNAARVLHAMLDGLIFNWLLDPEDQDLVALSRQAYDIFEAGLQPRAPGA
ncbi:MAG: TetR family transcriptional regulator [Comamonas sp.]